MFRILLGMALSMLWGAVVGLIPFFLGRYMGKPEMGRLGWKWSMVSGLLFLSLPVAIGFVVAIIVCRYDYSPARPSQAAMPATMPASPAAPAAVRLGITCLSGPFKGRTYTVGGNGILIGRDQDCAIRFTPDTPGISRHHCSLRWQQGTLVLTDLDSAYGTYMADGRRLPPQYPTRMATGSCFYLANSNNLFQIVITA